MPGWGLRGDLGYCGVQYWTSGINQVLFFFFFSSLNLRGKKQRKSCNMVNSEQPVHCKRGDLGPGQSMFAGRGQAGKRVVCGQCPSSHRPGCRLRLILSRKAANLGFIKLYAPKKTLAA